MSLMKPFRRVSETPRRGQALAEFALTLPIMLLLIFGIIEFGRLFQTWIVLQSAARAGARAASVGAINYDLFNVTVPPASTTPRDLLVLNGIVPCVTDDNRGTIVTDGSGVKYYDGEEGLFATVYDGMDCDPASEDHTQLRKDILRIFTVIGEVRRASGTIAVYESRVDQRYDNITPEAAFEFFRGYWSRPFKNGPNSLSPGWISVETCSSRPVINGVAASAIDSRFVTVRNTADAVAAGGNVHSFPTPFCMLNERPAGEIPGALNNAGYRWFDVGGPGDRVTVFIKFNHPLITPLNLAQYIYLESRRSSVNESFRPPKAVGAFQRSIPPGRDPDDEEETVPTLEPSPEPTTALPPSPVPPSPVPSATASPVPFSCDNVRVIWSDQPFVGPQLFMTIVNTNEQPTQLRLVKLRWNTKPGYQAMYAQAFSLNGNVHWQGSAPASPPQTEIDTNINGTFYDGNPSGEPDSNRFIASNAIWSALFVNGPSSLGGLFRLSDFTAEFQFTNPEGGSPCLHPLEGVSEPEPTETPVPTVGPSPTPTPSCDALSNIQLQHNVTFDAFDGSVRMNLFNTGTLPVYLLGFSLVWPDRTHPGLSNSPTHHLRRVTVGGTTAGDANSVEVWRSSAVGQDASGNTRTTLPFNVATSSTSSEGTWLSNAILRPGNNYVFLDFDGFTGSLTRFGASSQHFHQSQFFIGWAEGCTTGTGPGTVPTSSVQIALPSPTQTNTPAPTNTPRPTNTPAPTNTPRPTNTPVTPAPTLVSTSTYTATPVTPSPVPSRTPFPTQEGGGGSERP